MASVNVAAPIFLVSTGIALLFATGVSIIFVIPCFILLPMMLGDKELWLAVPLSEMLTFGVILLSLVRDRMKNGLL